MSLKYLTNINLNQNELQNFAVQKLTSAPESPVLGQMYFNTTDSLLYLCTAAGDTPVWTPVGSYTFSDGLTDTNRVITVKASNGIAVSSSGVAVDFTEKKGLGFNSSTNKLEVVLGNGAEFDTDGKVAAKANTAAGVAVDSNGIGVVLQSTKGLGFDTDGKLGVLLDTDSGVKFNDAGKVGVSLESNKGLAFVSTTGADKGKLGVVLGAGAKFDTNGAITADLEATNATLQIDSNNKLAAKLSTAEGLEANSNGIAINEGLGLEFATNGGSLQVKKYNGIDVDSNGVGVKAKANSGLAVTSDGVEVTLGNGVEFGTGTDAGKIQVKPKSNSGLAVTSSGVEVLVDDKAGLTIDSTSGKLQSVVDTASGLAIDSTSGKIKGVVNTAAGLKFNTDGKAEVVIDTAKALAFDTDGKLGVSYSDGLEVASNALKVKAGNGIAVASTGVAVTAASGIEVGTSGVGVKVKKVNDVAQGLAASSDGLEVLLDADANLSFDASGKITLATDSTPTESSTKPLTSGAAYTSLAGKVDRLTTEHSADVTTVSVVTYDKQGLVTGGSLVALGSASVTATGVTGVATLGTDGLVPSSQLPSYVDDVVDAYTDGDPAGQNGKLYSDAACTQVITPDTGKIYVIVGHKTSTESFDGNIYRWSGSVYVCISNPIKYAETTDVEGETVTETVKVVNPVVARHAVDYWAETLTDELKNKTIVLNATGNSNSISGAKLDIFGEYSSGNNVVQTTVRSATDASDSAIPTEKAVRSALSEVVGGAVHRFTATNPDLSPSSGVCTWTISSTGLDADVEVQIKEVATGDYVFADVTSSTAGTVVIKFNASADVAKGTYKAIITGVNA